MDAFAGECLDFGCGSNLGILTLRAYVCVLEVGRQRGAKKPALGDVGICVWDRAWVTS